MTPPRIYGLETEYALFQDSDRGFAPDHKTLFGLLHRALTSRVRSMRALYHKGGDFLENGSLIHYESQPAQWLHGVLEWATPECLTPRELLAYSRAQMRSLPELALAAEDSLARQGRPGRVVLAKNNMDAQGNSYGCHENYLVEDVPGWGARLLRVPAYALLWAVFVVLDLFTFVPLILFLLFLVLLLLVVRLLLAIPGLNRLLLPVFQPLLLLGEGLGQISEERFIRYYGVLSRWMLAPFIAAYSVLALPFLFTRIRREIVPFLVTRPLVAGAGHLHVGPEGVSFRLSARSRVMRRIMQIFWDGPDKPMLDVKHYFLYPGQVFRKHKRLHLLCGDSNLSEVSEYLKIGTTGLVISAIEKGGLVPPIRLADPIAALAAVSADPTGRAQLALVNGGTITALEVQEVYLAACRRLLPVGPASADAGGDQTGEDDSSVLTEWEAALTALKHEPAGLYTSLDWAAKKQLMDEILLPHGGWDFFEGWGVGLALLEEHLEGRVLDAETAVQAEARVRTFLPTEAAARVAMDLARRGASWQDLALRWQILLALRKIDLKYHQVTPADGYYLELERKGLMRRLLVAEEVERAQLTPPARTRARLRGAFIKAVHGRGIEASAGWDKLRIDEPVEIGRRHYLRRRVSLDDPFDYRNPVATRFLEDLRGVRRAGEE